MCTMCTVYSFSREGVGQQDVYNVYSFFAGRYLANLRGRRAEESKYYLHIYYILLYSIIYQHIIYNYIYYYKEYYYT